MPRSKSTEFMATVLIIEDEAKLRRLLELNLAEDGLTTLSASDAESGLRLLRENTVDLVLTDLKLPGISGLEFLHAVREHNTTLPVVVMTAFGSVETAVEAMKAGASDYVLKPFSLAEMRMVVRKELDVRSLREENRSLREALGQRYAHPNIVARSPKMQEVLSMLERVAQIGVTVNCKRFEWIALRWNADALRFYDELGAKVLYDWVMFRMEPAGMKSLAHKKLPADARAL